MAAPSDYHADQSTTYVRSFPYRDERPSRLPRVLISPPQLDYSHSRPTYHVLSTPFELRSGEYGDPVFLRSLTACYDLNMRHSGLTWQYEMRRTAQPILPFLYLGPSSAAKDPEFINRTGITLLVAVRHTSSVKTRPNLPDPALFTSSAGISTLTLDFGSPFDFIPRLRPVIKAINDHLAATCSQTPSQGMLDIRGRVLVYCESGNERSMVLIAAYLMVMFGIDPVSAIHVIQSQRYSVITSAEMNNVLFDLQEIIKAERQVAAASPSGLPPRPVKRNIDYMYDSDDDAGLEYQRCDSAQVREGVAPFADVDDWVVKA
ncbi:hypothetical protein A1O3_02355 [Capronia epimyces CBS 606.96]|uniref:Tyrosine specific protein phosphatases domain-containing protein n=1 Tax=Capronia epimyces CBS 606.96 TaxID=1182542 RepID=W9Z445_9EURO|nr:uncharacterized protein A1O3_02355 [Capronia epimyces CBS 606.96]EXJ89289.1 hypothetical protein A1O3_02355 [Capronia epimyces CBS 606.96]